MCVEGQTITEVPQEYFQGAKFPFDQWILSPDPITITPACSSTYADGCPAAEWPSPPVLESWVSFGEAFREDALDLPLLAFSVSQTTVYPVWSFLLTLFLTQCWLPA
jgi:hypothetical protein